MKLPCKIGVIWLQSCCGRRTTFPVWLMERIRWSMLGQILKPCERSPQLTSWDRWNLLLPRKKNSSNSWQRIQSSDFIFRLSMILCWNKILLVWWNHFLTSTSPTLLLWLNSQLPTSKPRKSPRHVYFYKQRTNSIDSGFHKWSWTKNLMEYLIKEPEHWLHTKTPPKM